MSYVTIMSHLMLQICWKMLEIMERNHHGFHTVPREDPMPAGHMELVGPPGTVIPTRWSRHLNDLGEVSMAIP